MTRNSLEQGGRLTAAAGEYGTVDALKKYGGRLTTKEAAEALNRTPRRIRAMIQSGSILGILHGRDYIISVGEVQKILDKRESKRLRAESERKEKANGTD